MGSIGPTELLIIAGVVILLFGGSRIADLGKGCGQAIKNFKRGVRDDEPVSKDEA
jgi:sec-independent protein translocase protein TatA